VEGFFYAVSGDIALSELAGDLLTAPADFELSLAAGNGEAASSRYFDQVADHHRRGRRSN
jgi:hypothetical protein